MTIIDAQVHIWGADTPERPWPQHGQSYAHRPEPFGQDALLREMDAAGVDRVVMVLPSWAGERHDLALAAARWHPERFAMMGRLAIERPESRQLHPGKHLRPCLHHRVVTVPDMGRKLGIAGVAQGPNFCT